MAENQAIAATGDDTDEEIQVENPPPQANQHTQQELPIDTQAQPGNTQQVPPVNAQENRTVETTRAILRRLDDQASEAREFRTRIGAAIAASERRADLEELNRNLFGTTSTPPPSGQRLETTGLTGRTTHHTEVDAHAVEMTALKEQLREMSSQVHKAVSSAPEIERVVEETQRTPFTSRITGVQISSSAKIKLPVFEGNNDPGHYMTAFAIAMGRTRFTPEEKDAGYCQMFVENLGGAALTWFSRLPSGTIDNFNQLSTAFVKHYSMFIEKKASTADLWTLTQGGHESLREFIERYKKIVSRIVIPDEAAIAALRNSLWYESRFREELVLNQPQTLEDALHRANRFIEAEEEKAVMTKLHAKERPTQKNRDEYREPRQHYDREREKKKNIVHYVRGQEPQGQASAWRRDDDRRAFCEFHGRVGHSTAECRHLKSMVLKQYGGSRPNQGNDRRQPEARRAQDNRDRRPTYQGQDDRGTHPRQPVEADMEPPKREREEPNEEAQPVPRRRINVIMGGLLHCNDSVRALKKSERRVVNALSNPKTTEEEHEPLRFTQADAVGVDDPHNDFLVIELMFGDCEVTRILVDSGSSVNIIFKETLTKMDYPGANIKPSSQPLTGFSGDYVNTIGHVKLPVRAMGTTKIVKMLVVDQHPVFNAILGTPWLYAMKAAVSIYHQCVKFPTPGGTKTIKGNQRAARTCFIAEHKARKKSEA